MIADTTAHATAVAPAGTGADADPGTEPIALAADTTAGTGTGTDIDADADADADIDADADADADAEPNTPHADSTPGRKRDHSRDEALRQAALEVLAEVGYDRLTIDVVAARVGAGKATVYRRWPSKVDLVVDAVGQMKGAASSPDTGTLRGDLEALTCGPDLASDPFHTSVIAGLVSAVIRYEDLRDAFQKNFIAPRRRILRGMFERAVERGEIDPFPDLELLIDVFPSMAFHRAFTRGEAPDAAYARTVIDQIILPLAQQKRTTAP